MIFDNAHIMQMICERLSVADIIALMRACRAISTIIHSLITVRTMYKDTIHSECIAHRVTTIFPRLGITVRDVVTVRTKGTMPITGSNIGTFAHGYTGALKFNIFKHVVHMKTTNGYTDKCIISYGMLIHKVFAHEKMTFDKLIDMVVEYLLLTYAIDERDPIGALISRHINVRTGTADVRIFSIMETATDAQLADICQELLEQ